MAFHIGKIIDRQIKENGMAKSELARRVKTTPQQIQVLLKRSSIDTEMLQRISRALSYNFFTHYNTGVKSTALSESPAIVLKDEISTIKQEIDVLARHNGYLRELLSLHNIAKGAKLPVTNRKFSPINSKQQQLTNRNRTKKKTGK
jgi:hypothetical protein